MAVSTHKLAPRIIINEHDLPANYSKVRNNPVTMVFGFSPIGRTCEMVVCNEEHDITEEFGEPESAPEKYFIDAGLRLVRQKATAIMTRLPYDNDQSHKVKFVDYQIEEPIGYKDISTGPSESITREKDDIGVTILKEMHDLDSTMNQYQRITHRKIGDNFIGSMTNEELVELDLDPKNNLETNTFRIVDIVGQQYGIGLDKTEYTGIFTVIVPSPTALYYQNKIKNTTLLDKCFPMLDVSNGVEMSTDWFRTHDDLDDKYKLEQRKIVNSIVQDLNFNTQENRFHRQESFQDKCTRRFPLINILSKGKLDKTYLRDIGILVCRIGWDSDQQITTLDIVESFNGYLGYGRRSIDKQINENSKYIRMYKNLSIDKMTDFFVIDNQKINSLGMSVNECQKTINYKTSIMDPINFMLEHVYSDVDSLQVDVILDAGLSSIAFAAYVAKNQFGETFKENEKVTTRINWQSSEYSPEEHIEDYAFVWNKMTEMFGDFIKTVRGDCVYIADGPRILNLTRNYPIRNYTDMENVEMFNKFLPFFNGNTNNYVARYFNWVFVEDMQYANQGIWLPPSVVMGSQLAFNDKAGEIWYAPAGQERGLIDGAFDISVRTKQYNQENDILYQNNWNFFNVYQNEGVVVEGQKTLQIKKTSLDRLNVRRMVCYIKQQARMIANKYKYEPHTESVRNSFQHEIIDLLKDIQRTNGISAYQVICDTTNNTTETIDRHELWCKIAIKPIKAIEYIIIDLNVINGKIGMNDNQVIRA